LPVIALLLIANSGHAQQGGHIAGVVRDRSGDAIADAEVRVQSEDTGTRQDLKSDADGHYSTTELQSGFYRLTFRRQGFRTSSYAGARVTSAETTRIDMAMDVLPLHEEMTVAASQTDVDPAVSGLTVSRNGPVGTFPQNGRDVHSLYAIMPGATITPASLSDGGQFTVSGQRPNANSFWVDGTSANVGIGVVSVPGSILGGSLPGMTTIGGLQSLASSEETERVDLRSADFSAEFGDRPGAQITVETRAGSNEFHGSAFGYIRPREFDSQDWFARGAQLNLPAAFLDGWGGSLGGPLWRNRTYFFVSLEKTDLDDDAVQLIPVPSLEARALAGPAYLALFDAFPQPTGRALNAYEAQSYSILQKSAAVTNRSVRMDQVIGRHAQSFARYSDVPSSSSSFDLGAALASFRWNVASAGLNFETGPFTHEIRFNYSNAVSTSKRGANDAQAFSSIAGALGSYSVTTLSLEGVGQVINGQAAQYRERQFAGSYIVSTRLGKNAIRAGFTYAKLVMNNRFDESTISLVSPNPGALLSAVPLGLTTSSGGFAGTTTQRYSAFAQDSISLTDRLHLLLGIRWDVTPSSFSPGYGVYAPANYFNVGYWRGLGSQPVLFPNGIAANDSTWPTRYTQFSPRLGLAYHFRRPNVILRAGVGLFYDTGLASVISNIDPLNIWHYVPSTQTPPPSSVQSSSSVSPVLSLPAVWEWRASVEKSVRETSLFSVSYFGSSGHNLLRNESTVDLSNGILTSFGFTTRGTASYNALMAQFRGQITPHLFSLVSYTWGHSIDNGSSDTSPVLADGAGNVGSSSFDVRQSLSASLSYQMPSHFGAIFRDWTVSSTVLTRTGFPFNVTTVDETAGLGFENSDRASLVAGQPVWLASASAPGGRILNPAAFQSPAAGQNGNLGRDVLTGPGLFQLDASVRRKFYLYRGISMEGMVSAFNLPNHPSFSNPVAYLGSGLFGQANSTANLMLGSGSPTTGLTPLFQNGGPRTVELSLRFSF
jgi:hypothetical protein